VFLWIITRNRENGNHVVSSRITDGVDLVVADLVNQLMMLMLAAGVMTFAFVKEFHHVVVTPNL
jgi:hypothetical protein